MRRFAIGMLVASLGLAVLGAAGAVADEASLFAGPGQRPGPAILYKRIKTAPQLTNAGVWRAKPILISGASAYRDGEFLYQDYLYDDLGAKADPQPGDPRRSTSVFSTPSGTYTYPTAPAYASNAADLVELRVKPLAGATAFRLTFNTLIDPELTAATIAIGTSSAPRQFPHGANASAPAELFLTWHGDEADLADAATGQPVDGEIGVDVDAARRQVTLRVPHNLWDPGRRTVRLAAGVGLWDKANGRYLLPQAVADAGTPGGAGGLARPTAFFNVAFRPTEPYPFSNVAGPAGAAWWRERFQSNALTAGDISGFRAFVNFDLLARKVDDNLRGRPQGVPTTGPMNRILSSRFQTGQGGVDFSDGCSPSTPSCDGELRGRLQPYLLYVPPKPPSGGRYQLTLLLHSLSANYNQFGASRNQSQFGDRSRPSLVITPSGRGPDGFYRDLAGADTFEVWADVAARYRLDPRHTTIAGYSMGGFGTFQLASQFPDLFARAQPTVGTMLYLNRLASVRWIPFRMWNATADNLVRPGLYRSSANALQRLGYRYRLDEFTGLGHVSLAANDWYEPAAQFLDYSTVFRNPPRVTFVRDTAQDFPRAGTTADHAYWVSRIRLRSGVTTGKVDVRSRGFGRGDPTPSDLTGTGNLEGGTLGTLPFSIRRTVWGAIPRIPVRDRLDITSEGVRSITIDARRARVSCDPALNIDADGPLQVRLRHCPRK